MIHPFAWTPPHTTASDETGPTSCVSPLLAAVGLVERGLEGLRQLDRVVVAPEVHVEEPRCIHETVVMQRRHVDAVLPEGPGYSVHLLVEEHKVPGDGCLAIRGRLKVHHRYHSHGGQQWLPHLGDRFGAGRRHLEDAGSDVPALA